LNAKPGWRRAWPTSSNCCVIRATDLHKKLSSEDAFICRIMKRKKIVATRQ
jgi:hypothetical protein